MIAVLKHELSSYFRSLTAYIFCAAILLFVGIGSMLYNIQSAVANFEYVLAFVCIGLTIIIPVLTMRIIADEKKQKTDQLLYSLPLKISEVIIGKYLALLVIFALPLCIVFFYPLIFSRFGDVYLPTSYGSLVAFFVMGAALIAIGMFLSSLTDNQGFAAGIAIGIFILNYYSVTLSAQVSSTAKGSAIALSVFAVIAALIVRYVTKNDNLGMLVGAILLLVIWVLFFIDSTKFEGLLPNIMTKISLFQQFYTFVNGVFDFTAIVYYASVIGLFLFLSVQSLEKRRYN